MAYTFPSENTVERARYASFTDGDRYGAVAYEGGTPECRQQQDHDLHYCEYAWGKHQGKEDICKVAYRQGIVEQKERRGRGGPCPRGTYKAKDSKHQSIKYKKKSGGTDAKCRRHFLTQVWRSNVFFQNFFQCL